MHKISRGGPTFCATLYLAWFFLTNPRSTLQYGNFMRRHTFLQNSGWLPGGSGLYTLYKYDVFSTFRCFHVIVTRPSRQSYAIELTLFIWQMPGVIPLKLGPNTVWSCNHQKKLHPACPGSNFSCLAALVPIYNRGETEARASQTEWIIRYLSDKNE